MDEARAVLRRLQRIEALQRERAGVRAVLAEVDLLLDEARAWLAAEGLAASPGGGGLEQARRAVDRTRKAMIPM